MYVQNFTDFDNITKNTWYRLQDYADKFIVEIKSLQQDEQVQRLLQNYIQPILHGIIFVIGLLGNGVLLVIFLKQKEMWTPTNIMLLNLAVGDIFSLTVNLPLFYIYSTSRTWKLGETMCKVFCFTRNLGIWLSVFSVMALSILRFCAAVQSSRGKHLKHRLSKFLVVCVWITASAFALPHAIFAQMFGNKCYNSDEFYTSVITLFEFFFVCIVPITIIIFLTALTACTLSLTINNTAKEGRRAIGRVSKILAGLTIVFAISYIPFYLYRLLFVWYDVLELNSVAHRVLLVVLYALVFGNACFNPVALYIVSHTFRHYFHKYLFRCGETDNHTNTNLTSYAEDVSQVTTPI